MEIWAPINEFNGYEVSTEGRIRSLTRKVIHPNGIKQIVKGQIMSTYINEFGYKVVSLRKTGNKNSFKRKVHRLVIDAFYVNFENKRTVNHKDLNKLNNNLTNLEYSTHKENLDHAVANGVKFGNNGELCSSSKITTKQMLDIRQRIVNGETPGQVSKTIDLSEHAIWSICTGRTWNHILDLIDQCNIQIKSRLIR